MRHARLTYIAVDCGAWCLVESRELAGVCRISMHILQKPSHTVVRCGVWCLGKSLAVKLTYDRLWCVVQVLKSPPPHQY